jgi:hypothetical protein
MIARPHVALAWLLCFGVPASAETAGEELWKLVAQSHLIVVGVPTVPIDQIETAQRAGKHDYVDIVVRVNKSLKGDERAEAIAIRYYSEPRSYSPSLRTLTELNGKGCVLFVIKSDEEGVQGFYFAGNTPKAIETASSQFIVQVGDEVLAQKQITNHFGQIFRPENEPSCGKVRPLIEAMLSRHTEEKAFAELEAMGKDAVPAMIMFMDDRRKLPIQHIALRNDGGFEAFRQYAPQVVVDALAALLNQTTGEIFGFIFNGASERERKEGVDAWRIYLYRTRFGTKPVQ